MRRLAMSVAAAVAVLMATVLPAAAGSNGQELVVQGSTCYSVVVYGYNQNGTWINGHGWNTPNYSNLLAGWWWIGEPWMPNHTYVYEYTGSNGTGTLYQIVVTDPVKSQSSDYWYVPC